MKRQLNFLGRPFTFFLRLQIYEAIFAFSGNLPAMLLKFSQRKVTCLSGLLLSKKACNNYFSPLGLFYAIFHLTNFLSDPFDFSCLKTG